MDIKQNGENVTIDGVTIKVPFSPNGKQSLKVIGDDVFINGFKYDRKTKSISVPTGEIKQNRKYLHLVIFLFILIFGVIFYLMYKQI